MNFGNFVNPQRIKITKKNTYKGKPVTPSRRLIVLRLSGLFSREYTIIKTRALSFCMSRKTTINRQGAAVQSPFSRTYPFPNRNGRGEKFIEPIFMKFETRLPGISGILLVRPRAVRGRPNVFDRATPASGGRRSVRRQTTSWTGLVNHRHTLYARRCSRVFIKLIITWTECFD